MEDMRWGTGLTVETQTLAYKQLSQGQIKKTQTWAWTKLDIGVRKRKQKQFPIYLKGVNSRKFRYNMTADKRKKRERYQSMLANKKTNPRLILEQGKRNQQHEHPPGQGPQMMTGHHNHPHHQHHEITNLGAKKSWGRVSITSGKAVESVCNNFNCGVVVALLLTLL